MSLPRYLYQRLLCAQRVEHACLSRQQERLTREKITESDYVDVTADAMFVCVLKH